MVEKLKRKEKKCNSDTVSNFERQESFLFAGSAIIVIIQIAVQTLYCHIVFQY